MDNKIGIYPEGLKLYKSMIFQIRVCLRQPKFKKIVCEWWRTATSHQHFIKIKKTTNGYLHKPRKV